MSDGFFLAALPAGLAPGDEVEITGPEARHLVVVRRIRLGEIVTLADGQGHGVRGPVVEAGPPGSSQAARPSRRPGQGDGRAVVRVDEVLADAPPRPAVTVVQALVKAHGDLAADLMTEAGVDRIVPWQAARSLARWEPGEAAKGRAQWAAAAREAAKQSRRLTVPEITPTATTAEVAALLRSARGLVMHEAARTPLAALAGEDLGEAAVIVIGPEGGLTDAEVAAFEAAGATAFSLGPTVLRATTAGAIATAQVRLLAALRPEAQDG